MSDNLTAFLRQQFALHEESLSPVELRKCRLQLRYFRLVRQECIDLGIACCFEVLTSDRESDWTPLHESIMQSVSEENFSESDRSLMGL